MERVPVWTPLPSPSPQGGRERSRAWGQSAASLVESARSNIRGEVHELVEQHAGGLQHPFDLVSSVRNRAGRRVDHELGSLGSLVVVADAGERRQRAGAGLLVMALGIAIL